MTGAPLPPQPPGTRRANHSFCTLFPKPFNGGLLLSRTLFLASLAGKRCRLHSPGMVDKDSPQPSPPRSSSSPPVGMQQPSLGSTGHPAARGVMGAALSVEKSVLAPLPKAAEMWRCPQPGHGGDSTRAGGFTLARAAQSQPAAARALPGSPGSGRPRGAGGRPRGAGRGLWLGCGRPAAPRLGRSSISLCWTVGTLTFPMG